MRRLPRALVMGGAGFVGSHLCDRLVEHGWHVFALDDLESGSLANVAHLRGHDCFDFVQHDVVGPFQIPVDRIYNLACPESPRRRADPIKTTLTSVLGTLHALELARHCHARVFFASTSDVYGDAEVHPQHEAYRGCVSTTSPRACYDEGKRCAESMMMDFARMHGVEVRVARIFDTYGPRMDPTDGRIVPSFVARALAGEDLTVFGDGTQTRSFCFIDDMIDGITKLMEHPTETGPMNLGKPEELRVIDVAQLILRLTASKSRIVYRPLPQDDPAQRRPVIEFARKTLGFEPKVPLADGLEKTIEYFRHARSADRQKVLARIVPVPRAREAANGNAR